MPGNVLGAEDTERTEHIKFLPSWEKLTVSKLTNKCVMSGRERGCQEKQNQTKPDSSKESIDRIQGVSDVTGGNNYVFISRTSN